MLLPKIRLALFPSHPNLGAVRLLVKVAPARVYRSLGMKVIEAAGLESRTLKRSQVV